MAEHRADAGRTAVVGGRDNAGRERDEWGKQAGTLINVNDEMFVNLIYYDSLISLNEFCAEDFHFRQFVPQRLQLFQVLHTIGGHLPEHDVLQVHESARGQRYGESTVVRVLLADACDQAWPVVKELEGLVAKFGTENGTVSTCHRAELYVVSYHVSIDSAANEGQLPALVLASSQEQSLEVFGCSGDHVVEELS